MIHDKDIAMGSSMASLGIIQEIMNIFATGLNIVLAFLGIVLVIYRIIKIRKETKEIKNNKEK
jgi:uncharacterized membrane protein